MVEEFRKAPVENMDEVIYCVNGTYRLLEFLVSLQTSTQCTVSLSDPPRPPLLLIISSPARLRCVWCATVYQKQCSGSGV